MNSITIAAFKAGNARMTRNELTKTIQTNNGSRRMVNPGARSVRIVAIRLIDAATEPTPRIKSDKVQ
jgi:hypothetical protein